MLLLLLPFPKPLCSARVHCFSDPGQWWALGSGGFLSALDGGLESGRKYISLLAPFYRGGSWASERSGHLPEDAQQGTAPGLEPGPTQTPNLASSHHSASPACCVTLCGQDEVSSQGDPECSSPRSKGAQMPSCSGMRLNPSPPSPVLGQSPAQEYSSGASD